MLIHRNRPRPVQKPRTWPEGKPKPTLPMTRVPLFRIHYRALEEYLARVYHMQEYDFIRATGAVAGMTPEYTVQAQLPPAHDAQQRADAIRLGHRTQNVPLILTVLCIDGFIPEGTYVIDTRRRRRPSTCTARCWKRRATCSTPSASSTGPGTVAIPISRNGPPFWTAPS